jgi:hypothetical protein
MGTDKNKTKGGVHKKKMFSYVSPPATIIKQKNKLQPAVQGEMCM